MRPYSYAQSTIIQSNELASQTDIAQGKGVDFGPATSEITKSYTHIENARKSSLLSRSNVLVCLCVQRASTSSASAHTLYVYPINPSYLHAHTSLIPNRRSATHVLCLSF